MVDYPIPKQNQTTAKADWDDSVELGERYFRLPDERPVKVEIWAESGYTFNTYFFSTIGIADLSAPELLSYMRAQGVQLAKDVNPGHVGFRKWVDANGNELWTATVVVAESDW